MSVFRWLDPSLEVLVWDKYTYRMIVKKASELLPGDTCVSFGSDSERMQIVEVTREAGCKAYRCSSTKEETFLIPMNGVVMIRANGLRHISFGTQMEMNMQGAAIQKEYSRQRCKLFFAQMEFITQDLPIHPYMMGYWLCKGQGCLLKVLSPEIMDRLVRVGAEVGISCTHYKDPRENRREGIVKPWAPTPKPPPDTDGFVEIGKKRKVSSGDTGHQAKKVRGNGRGLPVGYNDFTCRLDQMFVTKLQERCNQSIRSNRIPSIYMYGDREQRIELLSGIVDAVGHLQKRTRTYDLTLRNTELLYDIQFVAQSLGLITTIVETSEINGGRFTGAAMLNKDGRLNLVQRLFVGGDLHVLRPATEKKRFEDPPKHMHVVGFEIEKEVSDANFVKVKVDSEDGCFVTNSWMVWSGKR